jgi:hypothetical protein
LLHTASIPRRVEFSLSLFFKVTEFFSLICHCVRTRAGVALNRVGLSPVMAAAIVRRPMGLRAIRVPWPLAPDATWPAASCLIKPLHIIQISPTVFPGSKKTRKVDFHSFFSDSPGDLKEKKDFEF